MREWEARLAPVLSETLRKQRRGRVGRSWYGDETYLKVKRGWTSLYRAVDRDGNLVDVYLSKTRDRAAEAFFRSARTVPEIVPIESLPRDPAPIRERSRPRRHSDPPHQLLFE